MPDPITDAILDMFPYKVRVGSAELRFPTFAQAAELAGLSGPRITFTDEHGIEHLCERYPA